MVPVKNSQFRKPMEALDGDTFQTTCLGTHGRNDRQHIRRHRRRIAPTWRRRRPRHPRRHRRRHPPQRGATSRLHPRRHRLLAPTAAATLAGLLSWHTIYGTVSEITVQQLAASHTIAPNGGNHCVHNVFTPTCGTQERHPRRHRRRRHRHQFDGWPRCTHGVHR